MSTDLMPSRKDKILIFTIIGWAACAVFHFVAYSMAKEDLAMMDNGVMDERDRDTINLCASSASSGSGSSAAACS